MKLSSLEKLGRNLVLASVLTAFPTGMTVAQEMRTSTHKILDSSEGPSSERVAGLTQKTVLNRTTHSQIVDSETGEQVDVTHFAEGPVEAHLKYPNGELKIIFRSGPLEWELRDPNNHPIEKKYSKEYTAGILFKLAHEGRVVEEEYYDQGPLEKIVRGQDRRIRFMRFRSGPVKYINCFDERNAGVIFSVTYTGEGGYQGVKKEEMYPSGVLKVRVNASEASSEHREEYFDERGLKVAFKKWGSDKVERVSWGSVRAEKPQLNKLLDTGMMVYSNYSAAGEYQAHADKGEDVEEVYGSLDLDVKDAEGNISSPFYRITKLDGVQFRLARMGTSSRLEKPSLSLIEDRYQGGAVKGYRVQSTVQKRKNIIAYDTVLALDPEGRVVSTFNQETGVTTHYRYE